MRTLLLGVLTVLGVFWVLRIVWRASRWVKVFQLGRRPLSERERLAWRRQLSRFRPGAPFRSRGETITRAAMVRGAVVRAIRRAVNVRTEDVYDDGEIVGERVASALESWSDIIGGWPAGQQRLTFRTDAPHCLSLVGDPSGPVLVVHDLDSPRFFVFALPAPAPTRVPGAAVRTAFRAGYAPDADEDEDEDDDW